jgi:Ca-activated chloride channel homolog
MKLVSFLFLLAFIGPGPGDIGKVNTEKSEAKKAYQRGEFNKAVTHYKTLIDSMGIKEDEVSMNLAHAYFELNDTVNSQNSYSSLTTSHNARYRSLANQQLGVLANRQGKFEEALNYFKTALKADPANEEARYNYEMVKKKLEEKKKQEEQQQQQNKDQKKDDQKKDQKDQKENKDKKDQKDKNEQQKKDDKEKQEKDKQDQKNKDQQEKEKKQKEEQQKKEQEQKDSKDKKEIPPSVSEKLKDMKMSEDKARMVLEAMKNQEVQYLQQNKRKATKPRSKGKPDW